MIDLCRSIPRLSDLAPAGLLHLAELRCRCRRRPGGRRCGPRWALATAGQQEQQQQQQQSEGSLVAATPRAASSSVSPAIALLQAAQAWPPANGVRGGGGQALSPLASGADILVRCPMDGAEVLLRSSMDSVDGDEQSELAAYLYMQGLDPAALEREAPEAYCRLTLPLAEVLAEAHTACATDWQGENAWCGRPSQLMVRIQRLHSEVGLSAEDIAVLWRQVPYFFRFKEGGAERGIALMAGVMAWLRNDLGLSSEEVSRVWRSQLSLFAFPARTLQHNLLALLRCCPLAPAQQRSFLVGAGSLLASAFSEFLAKLESTAAAAPGIEPAAAGLLASGRGGQEICDELDDLLQKAHFLRRFGFSRAQLREVLQKEPQALSPGLRQTLRPALEGLEAAVGSREGAVAAVCKQPELLAASWEHVWQPPARWQGLASDAKAAAEQVAASDTRAVGRS